MINKGQVSVIIPVYNAEKFIERAIKSAQLEEVGEIIIVDDKFPDHAIQIVEEIQKTENRIIITEHPDGKNHGAAASRNLGIKMAKFKYLAFLDADDYYLPNRFVDQLKFLEHNPEFDGCYGKLGFEVDETLGDKNPINAKETGIDIDVNPEDLLFTLLAGKHGHIHVANTILFKTSIFNKIAPFDTKYKISEDMEFLFRITAQFKFKNCPLNKLIAIRYVHAENRVRDIKLRVYDSYNIHTEGLKWLWSKELSTKSRRILAGAYFSAISNYYLYIKTCESDSIPMKKSDYKRDLMIFIKNHPKWSLFTTYLRWLKYYFLSNNKQYNG